MPPTLPACFSKGETFQEAKRNVHDAVQKQLESLLAEGKPVRQSENLVYVEELRSPSGDEDFMKTISFSKTIAALAGWRPDRARRVKRALRQGEMESAANRMRLAIPIGAFSMALLAVASVASAASTGGTLTALIARSVDSIDPGRTHSRVGFTIASATQKALYSFAPEVPLQPIPDLADGSPEISGDGRRVTVHIKRGVRFSPPIDREVRASDVKYAIERGFFKTVNNGYAAAYFANIAGAKTAAAPGTEIEGISTPDELTIVFELSKPTPGVLVGALSLPLTAPVPADYAAPLDRRDPSTYGCHQVATGPYMIENDEAGNAIGYVPGEHIHLVRNPNWDEALDYKPAYVDTVEIQEGNDDLTAASRRIIGGQSLINLDFDPPPEVLEKLALPYRNQLSVVPAGVTRWVALNAKMPPFDSADVRKAVVAGFDRTALLRARGGGAAGEIPTHVIPPGTPGHEEAGGLTGAGLDFLAKPAGDPAISAEYFKKAGFSSGKYEGKDEELIEVVSASDEAGSRIGQIVKRELRRLGFRVRLELVPDDAIWAVCGVPGSTVAVCIDFTRFREFLDGQTMLEPTFNGDETRDTSWNWSQLDDPEINAAMSAAELLVDPEDRARAWGDIDRIVTSGAPVIPYQWMKALLLRSANVRGAVDHVSATWSLSWTSLEP